MARPTRSERRARRQQQLQGQPAAAAAAPPMVPPGRVARGAGGDGSGAAGAAQAEPRHAPGSGIVNFIRESWAELKKVDWPGQNQVIQGAVVVIMACVIVGLYLYLNDLVWKHVIQDLLLR